ncbi:MAG: hypothetical protein JOZ77_05875 [Candidatus Eremiobacteraeota bacterium]|nr:hypothetical protein [Candidatus Eremiobacteraeota bacterium]
MKSKFFQLVLFLFAPLVLGATVSGSDCPQCGGVERWSVKVLTAANTSSIDFSPQTALVSALGELSPPTSLLETAHVAPYELEKFTIDGCLFFVRQETDADYHLALADLAQANDTLIAEIPDAACADVCETPFAKNYTDALNALLTDPQMPRPASLAVLQVRQKTLSATTTASAMAAYRTSLATSYLQNPRRVELSGVGFFDFPHGQVGKAPNAFEIHPVLSFKYLQGTCTPPDAQHLNAWIMHALPTSD